MKKQDSESQEDLSVKKYFEVVFAPSLEGKFNWEDLTPSQVRVLEKSAGYQCWRMSIAFRHFGYAADEFAKALIISAKQIGVSMQQIQRNLKRIGK